MAKGKDEVRPTDEFPNPNTSTTAKPVDPLTGEVAGTQGEKALQPTKEQSAESEKRHNLQLMEQYDKQIESARLHGNTEGLKELERLRDEAREKAGIKKPEDKEK